MKIKIPNSWKDIKLGQFIEISKFDGLSELDKTRRFLKMFNPGANIEDIIVSELEDINNEFGWMVNLPNEVHNNFEIDGNVYSWVNDLNSLTIGEALSYEILVEKATGYEFASIILAILLRLPGEEFDSNKISERRKLFENNLTIDQVYGTVFFLTTGEMLYTGDTNLFLETMKEMQMEMMEELLRLRQESNNLERNGSGLD